ncbi:MAG: putative selenate ABC transporter substrate-binding protein [Chloroflexota bacterium]
MALSGVLAGCAAGDPGPVLVIGGIPDQDVSLLQERFDGLAAYLSEKTGYEVRYVPSVDYAAVVTAFRNGDIQLAWFGGLTGVQARLLTPGAQAIAQRPEDAQFHSVFVASPGLGISGLADIAEHSLTFGSESSTSGHLMPRAFLLEVGVDPETGLDGPPNYSGSHDATWKLVEAGSYQVGALNEAVWDARVGAGAVDTSKVVEVYRTPSYYDYHWLVRPDLDKRLGDGATQRVRTALLGIIADASAEARAIADAFRTDGFIPTTNSNYDQIQYVAERLDLITP